MNRCTARLLICSMRVARSARAVRRAWLAVVVPVGACASMGAPGPVIADRPGYTDAPTALPARAIELEVGATEDRVDGAGDQPSTGYRTVGEGLLRVGVGARSELRIFSNSYATRITAGAPNVSGIEDLKLGAKVQVHAAADGAHTLVPSAALLVATTLATGASGFGVSAAQPEVKLAVDWTTPSPFSLYANVGFGAIETDVERSTRAWTSIAAWYAVNHRTSVFVEGLGIARVHGSGTGTSGNYVDGGVTFLVNDRFQLDVRAGHGVGSVTSHERFVGAGVSRRW